MLKRLLSTRVTLPLGAVVAAGGILYAIQAGANTSWSAWDDAQTRLVAFHSDQQTPTQASCSGKCLSLTTDGAHRKTCVLTPGPQASVAACHTVLVAACTSACETR